MVAKAPQDIYARHLSSTRGYPLWIPEPDSHHLSYQPEGLRIGDVGVVVPESGRFDVFFNLCLPKDHQLHQQRGVPDDFDPIELSDADIRITRNAESAGQVLTTSFVIKVEADRTGACCELPSRLAQSGATDYKINFSSYGGSALVLPEGADRHDVRDPRPFFEQASRHAAAWYHFAEERLGRIMSHDSIYVITGFHKARSWSLAGYYNERGNGDCIAKFTVGAREGGNVAAGSSWESRQNLDWRVGPSHGPEIPNQSVFIRGFKIALRSEVQDVPPQWVSFQPAHPSGRSNGRTSGDSWLSNVWRGISKTIGVSGADRSSGLHSHQGVVRIEVERIPEILPVFHPSDVINQYILRKEPSARVAITYDSDWGFLLDKNFLRPEDLLQEEHLITTVSDRYTIVVRDGVAHLQSKSGQDTSVEAATTGNCATEVAQLTPPETLTIVSESTHRCLDVNAPDVFTGERRSTDIQSIPSKFGAVLGPTSPESRESLRHIKIIVVSDYICSFCYICDRNLRDAIEACGDLPICFDVEFRPFTLLNLSALPLLNPNQTLYRNAYVVKRFGKEHAEMRLKVLYDLAQKAGVKFAEDSIICETAQAHRLGVKAYRDGGQALQNEFNALIFEACHSNGASVNDEDVLVNAAVACGLMNEDEAKQFLQSTEYLDCVEKMVEAARAQGINGVPFVIIDGKWAVNGLQPKECFIQIFRKLAHLPPATVSGKS